MGQGVMGLPMAPWLLRTMTVGGVVGAAGGVGGWVGVGCAVGFSGPCGPSGGWGLRRGALDGGRDLWGAGVGRTHRALVVGGAPGLLISLKPSPYLLTYFLCMLFPIFLSSYK